MSKIEEVTGQAIDAFRQRCGQLRDLVRVYRTATEEIDESLRRRKRPHSVELHARPMARLAGGMGAKERLEENYLFDTRRFASGAQVAGDNLFFTSAIGQPGTNNGFVAPMVMTEVETNMDVPSQIPQGKDFVLTQIGISFNADAIAGDVALMLEIGALRFSKQGGQYTLHHGPGIFWPGGTGVYNNVVAGPSSNGLPDIRNCRKLAVPRILRQKDTFNYSYFIPRAVRNLDNSTTITLTNNVIMRIWLWGGQQDAIPV